MSFPSGFPHVPGHRQEKSAGIPGGWSQTCVRCDRRSPQQPFILVENRKLSFEAAGTGTPTLILEAGAGCTLDTWNQVWPELIKMTCAVRYDRAGDGTSDPAQKPRTIADMAADLDTLLHTAGIQGPYILVGHSLGGLLVRYFAHRHPGEIQPTNRSRSQSSGESSQTAPA